jgi:hypothetical protein
MMIKRFLLFLFLTIQVAAFGQNTAARDWWYNSARGDNFADWTTVGTPTITNGTSLATSVAGNLPTVSGGILAGDAIIAFTSSAIVEILPTGPSGFRRMKYTNGNNGSNGGDVGGRMATAWWKEAAGGESGTITFNLPEPTDNPAVTSVNTISVMIMVIRKVEANAIWDIDCVDAVHRILDESLPNAPSAIVCKSMNKAFLKKGDQIIVFNTANTDALTYTPRSATFAGSLSVTTVSENLFGSATTSGNDSYFFGSHYKITSGSATDFITYNATAVGTTTQRAPWVSTIMMRVRLSSRTPDYIPSAYDFIDPACIDDSQIDTRGGLWGKMVRNSAGSTVTYGIETYNGAPHFFTKIGFETYLTEVAYRSEVIFSQFPMKYLPATKYFGGFRLKSDNIPTHPYQWILMQIHPGSGGLPSSNHPIAYLYFSAAGEHPSGIQGYPSGSPPVGTLIAAIGMSRTVGSSASIRKYIAIPEINCYGTNIDIPIEFMFKVGVAGDGRVIIASNGVVKVDETAYATMASDPIELGNATPGTGSVAGVGANSKVGGYLYLNDTFGAVSTAKQYYDAHIGAGLTPEMKNYHSGFKQSTKTTTDWDYDDSYDAATLQKMILP